MQQTGGLRFIFLSGCPGSGKSTIANKLSQEFGNKLFPTRVRVVEVDEFDWPTFHMGTKEIHGDEYENKRQEFLFAQISARVQQARDTYVDIFILVGILNAHARAQDVYPVHEHWLPMKGGKIFLNLSDDECWLQYITRQLAAGLPEEYLIIKKSYYAHNAITRGLYSKANYLFISDAETVYAHIVKLISELHSGPPTDHVGSPVTTSICTVCAKTYVTAGGCHACYWEAGRLVPTCGPKCFDIHGITCSPTMARANRTVGLPSVVTDTGVSSAPPTTGSPTVIITEPHAVCNRGPPCDLGASPLGEAFEASLVQSGVKSTRTVPDEPRSVHDFNRDSAAATPYLTEYRALLETVKASHPPLSHAIVLDAHSYPATETWGLGSVPTMGVVLRPHTDPFANSKVDVFLIARMRACMPGTARVEKKRRSYVDHKGVDRAFDDVLLVDENGAIFFALVQGTAENYIMRLADAEGFTAILAEINNEAAAVPQTARFFAQSIVAAVLDNAYNLTKAYPLRAQGIVYSPVHGVIDDITKRDPGRVTIRIYIAPTDGHIVFMPTIGTIQSVETKQGRTVDTTRHLVRADEEHTANTQIAISTQAGMMEVMVAYGKPEYITDTIQLKVPDPGTYVADHRDIAHIIIGSLCEVTIPTTWSTQVAVGERVMPNTPIACW
jgi:phosphatidylserine decarboxylase